MQAWHYGLASPPTEYIHPDALDSSQASDSDSDCSSSATLASTASSLSTLASAASSSAWSAPSSQNSDFTTTSVIGRESYPGAESQDASQQKRLVTGKLFGESLRHPAELNFHQQTQQQSSQAREAIPAELRKNPRRTSAASSASRGCPPTLFRQVDRKVEFVDKLVDSATYIVEAIWPTSSVPCRADFGTSTSVLPLRKFIEETLRRSRTSYSTLQVGLYYLILIKPHIPSHDFTMEQTDESHASRVLQCGRRMFLAALILASKWLQDRNYSARAWSKISGLKICEINENELAFLAAVNWKLHIGEDLYKVWSDCVMEHTPSLPPSSGGSLARDTGFERECAAFKKLIQGLTPELDNLDDLAPTKERLRVPARLSSVPKFVQPFVLEPQPAAVGSPGRQQLPALPALGLLPTPRRLVTSSCGFSTPAVGVASQLLGRAHSMSSAMSHANAISASQTLDRWPVPVPSFTRSSPPNYVPTRRSSLANTVSTASSPESMVSDSSGQSRTSSISSASLLHHAPAYMQARRAVGERQKMVYGQHLQLGRSSFDDQFSSKRTLAVADMVDLTEPFQLGETEVRIASPDSYSTYLADDDNKSSAMDQYYQLSVRDAAFALQKLHNHRDTDEPTPKPAQTWSVPASQGPKRKRTEDSHLQESVRDLLAVHPDEQSSMWSDKLVGLPTPQPAYPTHCADWTVKRPRLATPDMYQPHLKEAYGQHLLIPSI